MDDIGLPKTPQQPGQSSVPRVPSTSAIGQKVQHGLLKTMSLRGYKAPKLDVTVQRLDTPEEYAKRFQQPVFGREARRDPNMLPDTTGFQFG